ncbi:MAG: hypothetical protein OEV08_00125 [Nitrospira sp.]|nr:hypothetical protein [Nitrospira sp.]
MSESAWAKLDRNLQEDLKSHGANAVWEAPIMIVLKGMVTEGTRSEREAAMAAASTDLVNDLARSGARDIAKYWINWSVTATVGLRGLGLAAERDDVKQIVANRRQRVMLKM